MAKGINPNIKKTTRKEYSVNEIVSGLISEDRLMLSHAITLIESNHIDHRKKGEEVLNLISDNVGNSIRLGITGSPGAGKSTFIDTLGSSLIEDGHKVAVLAIDPSSNKTQGSILGDKTRMYQLSTNPNAFIRPTATANILGGVARGTKEAISLCEAAGFDTILIESVGVGQSETTLSEMVDLFLLLLLPGGGDDVQGIKRGIVELADIMVINKNDGGRENLAEQSRKDFLNSVRLFHHPMEKWQVPVVKVSSLENEGFEKLKNHISKYISLSKELGYFDSKRIEQDLRWAKSVLKASIKVKSEELFNAKLLEKELEDGTKDENFSLFRALQDVLQQIEKRYRELQ